MTPTELAAEIWGPKQAHSRSRGARLIRVVARDLFDAPGQGGEWDLTDGQAVAIRQDPRVANAQPPN